MYLVISTFQPGASTSARTYMPLSDAQTEALSQFYSTRSKRPTHEERVALPRETGVDTERINRWYLRCLGIIAVVLAPVAKFASRFSLRTQVRMDAQQRPVV